MAVAVAVAVAVAIGLRHSRSRVHTYAYSRDDDMSLGTHSDLGCDTGSHRNVCLVCLYTRRSKAGIVSVNTFVLSQSVRCASYLLRTYYQFKIMRTETEIKDG